VWLSVCGGGGEVGGGLTLQHVHAGAKRWLFSLLGAFYAPVCVCVCMCERVSVRMRECECMFVSVCVYTYTCSHHCIQ